MCRLDRVQLPLVPHRIFIFRVLLHQDLRGFEQVFLIVSWGFRLRAGSDCDPAVARGVERRLIAIVLRYVIKRACWAEPNISDAKYHGLAHANCVPVWRFQGSHPVGAKEKPKSSNIAVVLAQVVSPDSTINPKLR